MDSHIGLLQIGYPDFAVHTGLPYSKDLSERDVMSGGASGLGGYVYQQKYLTYRVLTSIALANIDKDIDKSLHLVSFGIEDRSSNEAPAWDVRLDFEDGATHFIECKDTEITSGDRKVFYERIRDELNAGTVETDKLFFGWATDSNKQSTKFLEHISGMLKSILSISAPEVKIEQPSQVRNPDTAIQEAFYHLKKDMEADAPPPCKDSDITSVLSRLVIDTHTYEELEEAVQLLTTGIFSRGTAEAITLFITGELTTRVRTDKKVSYTIPAFLAAISSLPIAFVSEGLFRNLLTFNAASGLRRQTPAIEWRRIEGTPRKTWGIADRLPDFDFERSEFLVAPMGSGKTSISELALREVARRIPPRHAILVKAGELDADHLAALSKLCCLLSGLSPTWLAIDGLDEIDQLLRMGWKRCIDEIARLPNLNTFITARKEVVAAQNWLQDLELRYHKSELQEFSVAQVNQSFIEVGLLAPTNRSLTKALCNPLLLSLYASVVSIGDMPLADSGEVSGFQIIEIFWRRTVQAESEGLRSVGTSGQTQAQKIGAIRPLVQFTLNGEFAFARSSLESSVANGIEMLIREGVLNSLGTDAIQWRHDWVREYALVEHIATHLHIRDSAHLADAVARIAIDHVGRTAASGSIKWIINKPEWGTAQQYVIELWNRNQAYAREAIAIVMEGPSALMDFADLPFPILQEALTQAVYLQAFHWSDKLSMIPLSRFQGKEGGQLHALIVRLETNATITSADQAIGIAERLCEQNRSLLEHNGQQYYPTIRTLLEFLNRENVLTQETVLTWLKLWGGRCDDLLMHDFLRQVINLVRIGFFREANEVLRAILGLDCSKRWNDVSQFFSELRHYCDKELKEIFLNNGLLKDNPDSWFETTAEMLARILTSVQELEWPRTMSFYASLMKVQGREFDETQPFSVNYDEEIRIHDHHDKQDSDYFILISAIESALRSTASLEDFARFSALTDKMIDKQFSICVSLPLYCLLDCLSNQETTKLWHKAESLRLLRMSSVLDLGSLSDLRRLLRIRLTPTLTKSEMQQLADSVRSASIEDTIKLQELSDMKFWDVLSEEELQLVEDWLASDDIFEPTDPRVEPLFHVDQRPVALPNIPNSQWPHPEDEPLLHTVSWKQSEASRNLSKDELAQDLVSRFNALSTLLSREVAQSDAWAGKILDWCNRALESLKLFLHTDVNNQVTSQLLSSEDWEKELNARAPWWRRISDLAFDKLSQSVPEYHSRQTDKKTFGWNPSDPHYTSFAYLSALLPVADDGSFAPILTRLVETVSTKWDSWPSFTKATVFSVLTPWFWWKSPELGKLLSQSIESDHSPIVVTKAIDKAIETGGSIIAPCITLFINRIVETDSFSDSVRFAGKILGDASMLANQKPDNPVVRELTLLLDRNLDRAWQAKKSLELLIDGVLWGVADAVVENDTNAANSWSHLVTKSVNRWPFDSNDDKDRFPVRSVLRGLERHWPPELRRELCSRVVTDLLRLIEVGTLADFCELHNCIHDFFIGGRHNHEVGAQSGSLISDNKMVQLCDASSRRVEKWIKEGKKTDDWGWKSALLGQDTLDISKTTIELGLNKQFLKRGLITVADRLANCGLTEPAAELRILLRRQ